MSTKQDTVRLFMQTPRISCLRREQKFYKYFMLLRAGRGRHQRCNCGAVLGKREVALSSLRVIFLQKIILSIRFFSEDSWRW